MYLTFCVWPSVVWLMRFTFHVWPSVVWLMYFTFCVWPSVVWLMYVTFHVWPSVVWLVYFTFCVWPSVVWLVCFTLRVWPSVTLCMVSTGGWRDWFPHQVHTVHAHQECSGQGHWGHSAGQQDGQHHFQQEWREPLWSEIAVYNLGWHFPGVHCRIALLKTSLYICCQ